MPRRHPRGPRRNNAPAQWIYEVFQRGQQYAAGIGVYGGPMPWPEPRPAQGRGPT